MTDERKSVEKKEVEEKKHKYISAYKGKDEWLKTQEHERWSKQRRQNESEQLKMIQEKRYKTKIHVWAPWKEEPE